MTVSALVLLRNLTKSFGKCGLGWRVWSGAFESTDPAAAGPFSWVLKEGKGEGQKEMKEPGFLARATSST